MSLLKETPHAQAPLDKKSTNGHQPKVVFDLETNLDETANQAPQPTQPEPHIIRTQDLFKILLIDRAPAARAEVIPTTAPTTVFVDNQKDTQQQTPLKRATTIKPTAPKEKKPRKTRQKNRGRSELDFALELTQQQQQTPQEEADESELDFSDPTRADIANTPDDFDPEELDRMRGEISIDNDVALYLHDIGRIRLLKPSEEIQLASAIAAGQEAQKILTSTPNASPIDKKELDNVITQANNAREQMIKANLRLVVSVAKKYLGRGMTLLDLCQEGNIGMMQAVEKYDYRMGYKFSTYATWWIRQSISRSITEKARTIRVPMHMVDLIRKVGKTTTELQQKYEREPTTEEIATHMGMTPSKVDAIQRASWHPVSLETPVGEKEDSMLGDFIPDKGVKEPEKEAQKTMLIDQIEDLLGSLTEREKRVLQLRFGLNNDRDRTLEEVGGEIGITHERVRQIEETALRKIRLNLRNKRLRDFLE